MQAKGPADTVLIIAPPDDVHARVVAVEVDRLGGRGVMLHAADFPGRWRLSQSFDAEEANFELKGEFGTIPGSAVAGVWWRRVYPHEIERSVVDPEARRFARGEALAAFEGWVYGLGSRCVNPLANEQRADQKPFQLQVAREVGLDIPRTLVSNDPERVTAFREEVVRAGGGGLIYKILTVTYSQFGETRLVTDELVRKLDRLRHAPAIFQEFVEGRDLRITLVDGSAFGAEMVARQSGAKVDWRLDPSVQTRPYVVPRELVERLHRLRRRLGLQYGAVDLKLTPEGRAVFLEINPAGQFLFAEIHAGHRIAAALARTLLAPPNIDVQVNSNANEAVLEHL